MSFDLKIINGDLSINNGKLDTVINLDKLLQDILKICLTEAGSNQVHPWYGSFLSRSIIGTAQSTNMLASIAKNQLENTLNNLKELQALQVKSFQRVSPDEQLATILSINVTRNQTDPRLFSIEIRGLTKGFKNVTTNFTVNTI